MNRAIFSCPHPLNNVGPARPLAQVHAALQANYDTLLLEPTQFPQLKDAPRIQEAYGPAFDDVATHRLPREGPSPIYLGGGGASYHQMERIRNTFLTQCGTLWFSSHWKHAQRILAEEYSAAGIQAAAIHPYVAWRAQIEQRSSDFMVVPSAHCKQTYPEELHAKIQVAEFGVDTTHYTVQPKRTTTRLQVLFPATNPFRKGLRDVLRAWRQLPPGKFQLNITGANLQGPGLQEAASHGNPITNPGWVSDADMLKFYGNADVLLLPSLEEGQALASLEAAASGLPLILTPETGLPIEDGKQGHLVPSHNPAAIQQALGHLEHDLDFYRTASREARDFAEQRPWSKFQHRIQEILEEATA